MNAPGRSWRQHWPMPSQPRPIMIIGTGGIVKDAHLPAYRKAGFTVAGLYDHDRARAEALASEWGRSEEHTSELQSLMRISYAVFCLKKKKNRVQEAATN